MQRSIALGCRLAIGIAIASPVFARGAMTPQEPTATQLPPSTNAMSAETTGALQVHDDTLWGLGDGFKTRFHDQSFEFIPALGDAAPHNMPVHFQLQSVGRGQTLDEVSPALRQHGGLRVDYIRNETIERYDVERNGIKQSFVFDRLPAGHGDLVVRGAFNTELAVTPHDGGLRLDLEGVGGLYIGGVIGIDARGNEVAGSLHYANGMIEMSLPAHFVDRAALPLVLDPFIGSVFTVTPLANNDRDPDVAYDVTNDVYFVVWERIYSSTDYDIHGQRIAPDGTLVGGRVYIQNTGTNEYNPAVANVNVRNHFVVTYTRSNDIKASAVDASDGTIRAEIDVASGTDIQTSSDVGGEATTSDDEALCVWWNQTDQAIEAIQINVSSAFVLSTFDLTTIHSSTFVPPRYPRISKGGGNTGYHMIVYELEYSTTDHDPAFSIVDRNLTILCPAVSCTGALDDQLRPHCDGDGTQWVVAWQTQEATVTSKDDIDCRGVAYDGADTGSYKYVFTSPITSVTADTDDAEYAANVVMTGGSALVAWTDQNSPNYDTYFKSIDPFSCEACESTLQYWLSGTYSWDYNFAGCSQLSGGGTSDEALLVIESYDFGVSSQGDIEARRWDSRDGEIADLGGGCGSDEGRAYANCAIIGNANFEARVISELPSAPAFLIGSSNYSGLPCGSCQLKPDPYSGWVVATTTDAFGQASLAVAIPSDTSIQGMSLYIQWLISEPISPGCYLFGADMTNGLRLTIE